MALAASSPTAEPRSFSIGPLKIQLLNLTAADNDVSGTATADALSSVMFAHVSGLVLTAAPTFSGNVITLAFADPGAGGAFGQIIAVGR